MHQCDHETKGGLSLRVVSNAISILAWLGSVDLDIYIYIYICIYYIRGVFKSNNIII